MKDLTVGQCEGWLRKIAEHYESKVLVDFHSNSNDTKHAEHPVSLHIYDGDYYELVSGGATLQEALRNALEKIYREVTDKRSAHMDQVNAEIQKQREVLALLSESEECNCNRDGIGGSHEDHCDTVVL